MKLGVGGGGRPEAADPVVTKLGRDGQGATGVDIQVKGGKALCVGMLGGIGA